eukprot:4372777-Amphidinium_carterae.1
MGVQQQLRRAEKSKPSLRGHTHLAMTRSMVASLSTCATHIHPHTLRDTAHAQRTYTHIHSETPHTCVRCAHTHTHTERSEANVRPSTHAMKTSEKK